MYMYVKVHKIILEIDKTVFCKIMILFVRSLLSLGASGIGDLLGLFGLLDLLDVPGLGDHLGLYHYPAIPFFVAQPKKKRSFKRSRSDYPAFLST